MTSSSSLTNQLARIEALQLETSHTSSSTHFDVVSHLNLTACPSVSKVPIMDKLNVKKVMDEVRRNYVVAMTTKTKPKSKRNRNDDDGDEEVHAVGELSSDGDDFPNYYSMAAPASYRSVHNLCSVCGFLGDYTCSKCRARFCGLACKEKHNDTRCQKFLA